MSETYSIPTPPLTVTRVRPTDGSGKSFTLNTDGLYAGLWTGSDGGRYSWTEVLSRFGEVEPIPLTDFEAAVAWFREYPAPFYLGKVSTEAWSHARVLIEDALSRG
ncbi:MAG: hypothetical protein EKK42_20150 [Pseudonocardiaceae bacterium]|nr:MAG: hypothetical protein EKK42_20150 [Pseudonocardiaceae bacterium]